MQTFAKKIFTLLLCCTVSVLALAQEKDATQASSGTKKIKSTGTDRVVIDLFHDNWLDKPDNIETKWYGRGIGLYTMFNKSIIKKNVNIGIGFGISSHNVYHNGQIGYDPINDSTLLNLYPTRVPNLTSAVTEDSTNISYKKNKINTNYIDVPIELRFLTNANAKGKRFKVAVGGRVGYLINGHTKYKGDDLSGTGIEVKTKQNILPNINKFRYGATARIGYGNFNVFGYYSLVDMFNSSGPKITPFSVGISFNGM